MTRRAERQSGAALLLLVAAVAAIAVALVAALAVTPAAAGADAAARGAYLDRVARGLAAWYARHAPQLDTDAAAPPLQARFAEFGVEWRWGAQVRASALRRDGAVAYRTFVVWLPDPGGSAVDYDPATGVLVAGPQVMSVRVDGRPVAVAGLAETQRRLQQVVSALEAFAATGALADPQADVAVNHFRAIDCARPAVGELPCASQFVPLADTVVPQRLGLGAAAVSAWGGAIEFLNADTTEPDLPPFSARVRAQAPWGDWVEMRAVQAI